MLHQYKLLLTIAYHCTSIYILYKILFKAIGRQQHVHSIEFLFSFTREIRKITVVFKKQESCNITGNIKEKSVYSICLSKTKKASIVTETYIRGIIIHLIFMKQET